MLDSEPGQVKGTNIGLIIGQMDSVRVVGLAFISCLRAVKLSMPARGAHSLLVAGAPVCVEAGLVDPTIAGAAGLQS